MNGLTRISKGRVAEPVDAVEQSELGASNTVAGVAEDVEAVAALRVSVVTARRGVLPTTMVRAGAGTAQTQGSPVTTMMTLSMKMMMIK